jgi:secreted PhoX family phosphatase
VLYDVETSDNPILTGVDNVVITPTGDVLIAEDGGDMQIVVLTDEGSVAPLLQVIGHDQSEITGPAFDPSYQRLYFSSQRGSLGKSSGGITYEVSRSDLV